MSSLQSRIQSDIEGELSLGRWFEMGGKGSGHFGHRGRKGKRGGSAPSKGVGKLSAPTGEAGVSGTEQVSFWMSAAAMSAWSKADDAHRVRLKREVARDLAAASGVTEREAADFVRQWAQSSNGDDMRSLAIQQDAAKEFGVKTSEFTQGRVKARGDQLKKDTEYFATRGGIPKDSTIWMKSQSLMESDKQRAVLRAMYNETQAELKARGITEVRLYRGVVLNDIDYKRVESAGFANVPMDTNAIESWSVSVMTAGVFARGRPTGVVFATVVPAERILATPATGFGCLTEGEIIVLGGIDGDRGDIM